MTPLDRELVALASKIDSLSKRSVVGLFWACSTALLPEFQAWAAHRGEQTEPLLRAAMTVAYEFAAHGTEPPRATPLLAELEASTPPGESPDAFSSQSAQDCWICADVSIRILVESYDPGPAIWFALEPLISVVSEELYGVSQIGASDEEEEQVRVLLQQRKVAEALEFLRWATEFLQGHSSPTDDDLALVRSRASALSP